MMLYNRHSVYVFNQWVKCGLLRCKPFQSLRSIMWNDIESTGTKGYTRCELRRIFSALSLDQISVHTELTSADYLSASALLPLNRAYRLLLRCAAGAHDWDVTDYVSRQGQRAVPPRYSRESNRRIAFTGNRFGFFHCITARKVLSSVAP